MSYATQHSSVVPQHQSEGFKEFIVSVYCYQGGNRQTKLARNVIARGGKIAARIIFGS